jgi:hypothetical protein
MCNNYIVFLSWHVHKQTYIQYYTTENNSTKTKKADMAAQFCNGMCNNYIVLLSWHVHKQTYIQYYTTENNSTKTKKADMAAQFL